MQQNFMKTRPVLPLVLSMSLPMVLSMMVSSLYNIVDSYYVARISEDAMTALSLVYPVQNLINAVTIGFSIGANAVISYHLGAQETRKADAAAAQSIFWNALHGVVLTIACIAVMPPFLRMFTADEAIVEMGVRYSRIAFLFSMVIAASMSLEKIFQATGRMLVTMVCMMSGCVANIILDPVLIFGWGPFPAMGIEGAALANGIVQGMRPIVGYNYGAKENGRVRQIFCTGLALSAGIMVLGTVLCWAVPGSLIGLFSSSAQTIAVGSTALRIISVGFIISSVSVISCGALEGLGMGGPSLLISLLRYAVVILPLAFVLNLLWGPVGVWHAFWITEVIASAVSWAVCRKKVFSAME